MIFKSNNLYFWWRFPAFLLIFVLVFVQSLGLNTDGILLLSFKYSILSDPLLALQSWNYDDETPCSWNGVTCNTTEFDSSSSRVTSLVLPNSQLLGSIPDDLGLIQHLQHLDLSNNFLNGSLPICLFNSSKSELKILSLSNNVISGELPEVAGELKSLQFLNLSDNALTGKIPQNLTLLANLRVLSLSNNYFSGGFVNGFESLEVLDLSCNLINGYLPPDFSGENLHYLNLSYNRISGEIPLDFAKLSPRNVMIDLSFNNLTGEVPELDSLKAELLRGNVGLCGKPLKNPCTISSTLSTFPNASTTSPPAIAVIPKPIDSSSPTSSEVDGSSSPGQSKLKPGAIVAIIVGDLAGIGILFMIFFYVYQMKKRNVNSIEKKQDNVAKEESSPLARSKVFAWLCFRTGGETDEETSQTSSTDTKEDEQEHQKQKQVQRGGGSLVTLDGETELELETLLKASAYILGAPGSINSRYYWGVDEDLVIYDYVLNGSLANACDSSSPSLSF
ncbi:hypothetical protein GIB67_033805 [Kingdonia uniflora]|uniref:Leucine-rich repeat-containing N-terminal plant-type domain-containing protein n=1 Tax=Kingdonia uniflora TaxID=39325 RepID=A0A7J7LIL2_9MAGN|nr:hypothetical protein GIB67_033805 [Kingdonia uniflora]